MEGLPASLECEKEAMKHSLRWSPLSSSSISPLLMNRPRFFRLLIKLLFSSVQSLHKKRGFSFFPLVSFLGGGCTPKEGKGKKFRVKKSPPSYILLLWELIGQSREGL